MSMKSIGGIIGIACLHRVG